jgi:hypothetical protein
MKKLAMALLGATALSFSSGAQAADLPIKAAPVVQQPISGYIGFEVGAEWWKWNYSSTNPSGTKGLFGGEARVNWWLNQNFAIQSDLEFEAAQRAHDQGTSTLYSGRWNGLIGEHFAWRDPKRYAIGAFIAAEAHGGIYWDYAAAHDIIYGIEGQLYYDKLTLYGQVGGLARLCGSHGSDCYDTPKDAWFIRGVPRYFFTPNDKIEAEIGWMDGNDDYTNSRLRVLNWGAKYEHKFDNLPLSAFIEYAGFRMTSTDNDSKWNSDILKVGVNLWLNQPTLLANDRNGATFDMPKFIRALPMSCLVGGAGC